MNGQGRPRRTGGGGEGGGRQHGNGGPNARPPRVSQDSGVIVTPTTAAAMGVVAPGAMGTVIGTGGGDYYGGTATGAAMSGSNTSGSDPSSSSTTQGSGSHTSSGCCCNSSTSPPPLVPTAEPAGHCYSSKHNPPQQQPQSRLPQSQSGGSLLSRSSITQPSSTTNYTALVGGNDMSTLVSSARHHHSQQQQLPTTASSGGGVDDGHIAAAAAAMASSDSQQLLGSAAMMNGSGDAMDTTPSELPPHHQHHMIQGNGGGGSRQQRQSGANSLVKALLSSASNAFHPSSSSSSSGGCGHSNNQHHNTLPHHGMPQHCIAGSTNGHGSSPRPAPATKTGTTTAEPDRPIGYGAFGVVWSVTDPRDHKRVALKKMPNVFQNLASCKRVFRELRMLASFQHDNVLGLLDILQPTNPHFFQEIYVLTELMQSDLHKIIVSPQPLTPDHVKVFVYQTLRGLKYLHSANVLHRDIKPGNLLVNSNCILKICDFGLARIWDPNDVKNMTHEVVTQYYRAPELLMGARRYSTAVDVWSVGCIFAELLGRRILFQAQGPIEQLNLIIDLLGTPGVEEMRDACEGARSHVLKSVARQPNHARLYALTHPTNQEAILLLQEMLRFDPAKRISVEEALKHAYLEEGRMRFHSCMCTCCYTSSRRERVFTKVFDPSHRHPFDPHWERELSRLSMFELRDRLFKYVTEREPMYGIPLCINTNSATYGEFVNSSVAQPSELPPSPNAWD